MRRFASSAAVGLALFLSACDRAGEERTLLPPRAGSAVPAPAAGGLAAATPEPTPPDPQPGAFRVERAAHGFTVLAHDAPRLEVLRSLANEAEIALIVAPIPAERERIRVRALDAPLDQVLEQVLAGLPYTLHYAVDPRDGRHVPTQLTLGEPASARAGAPRGTSAEFLAQLAQERRGAAPGGQPLSREQIESAREARRVQEEEIQRDLRSEDAETRVDAVRRMGLDPSSVAQLEDVLASDPAPQVRAEAADQLAGADSASALQSLLHALDDPNPDVVVTTIEALEFAGDAEIVPDLRKLLGHPNPRVRQAAASAIELLE